jgi:3',5'-cyclic AMP phosphodiesterase CpdA
LVKPVVLAHTTDLHFGRDADLEQVDALVAQLPGLTPDAIVISGDLTQRARHGEFQRAKVFVDALGAIAPTLLIPGNHDVEWWTSPMSILGSEPKYRKYRRYFGRELAPILEIDGAAIAGVLTSYGIAPGSLTWNPNDMAVKGHLPRSEAVRLKQYFDSVPPEIPRVAVVHHNVLRGKISHRMGLAHWRRAQRQLLESGADLVLCGHDHQEDSGTIENRVVVVTANTHTHRSRGGRPSAFNMVTVDEQSISVQHLRWDKDLRQFRPSDLARYARARRA